MLMRWQMQYAASLKVVVLKPALSGNFLFQEKKKAVASKPNYLIYVANMLLKISTLKKVTKMVPVNLWPYDRFFDHEMIFQITST